MKIILMAAVTLDGKIARNASHFVDWSSREDKKLFYGTSKRVGVLIMGNNTFKTFPSPLPGRLHVVLTKNAEKEQSTPGRVEFTADLPELIVSRLEGRGYTEAVLAGGAQINSLFLKAGLVDEIWLTVEPLIFGLGVELFAPAEFNTRAKLLSVDRLNDEGSVLLRYSLR